MELLVWMQRADFSEHIQGCKSPGDPLNSSHFDAPNTKSAPTGYRRAPNIISQHYKQQLWTKASIMTDNTENFSQSSFGKTAHQRFQQHRTQARSANCLRSAVHRVQRSQYHASSAPGKDVSADYWRSYPTSFGKKVGSPWKSSYFYFQCIV